jgi:hypothetical protein
MKLKAIGLAAVMALTSTAAFAMGGGGSGGGAGAGVGWLPSKNPAECGGLVCFAKPPAALTAPKRPRKRLRGVGRGG